MVTEVPVVTYAPLPVALTAPLAEPAAPPQRCHGVDGGPAWCLLDVVNWIEAWRAVVAKANDDRRRAARIGAAAAAVVHP